MALEPGQVRVRVEASGLCHTDIHAAHGDWPVKPSPPFIPGHEGVGIVERARPRRDRGRGRRSRRNALARLRLRHLRLLRLGLGDALPRAEEHGLLDRRRLRRVRDRVRPLRRQGAGGDRPVRRGAADLRRRHDLQGDQGRRYPLVRPRRRLRRRRARPPGDPVRARSPADASSPSTSWTRSSSSPASSAPSSRSTRRRRTRSRRSRSSAAPIRRSRWRSRRARSSRPTARCAAAARSCSSPCPPTTR